MQAASCDSKYEPDLPSPNRFIHTSRFDNAAIFGDVAVENRQPAILAIGNQRADTANGRDQRCQIVYSVKSLFVRTFRRGDATTLRKIIRVVPPDITATVSPIVSPLTDSVRKNFSCPL
jgi:hypothetical protein